MIHSLLNILFPIPCILCGYLDKFLCEKCEKILEFQPQIRKVNDLKIYSSLPYKKGGLIEQLIESFKYKQQFELADLLASKMLQNLHLFMPEPSHIFVPVPLHKKREKERGFNQSALLAKALSKTMGLEYLPLLKRVRNTVQQASLKTRRERIKNLRGAFEVKDCPVKNRSIILVDDIVTTGSTLFECKTALETAGVRSVIAFTIANRE